MRCRKDPTMWPLTEIPQQFLFNMHFDMQHPLFCHPMGFPPIVPLICPDLMVRNLPVPIPPSSIHIISGPKFTSLNPDTPEFIPRSVLVKLKTEDNYEKKDGEQIKKDIGKNTTSSDEHNIEISNETTTLHSKFGKNIIIYNYNIKLMIN